MSCPPRPCDDDSRVDDPAFWSARYEAGLAGWDLGQPAPPVVRALAELTPEARRRALVPGCGRGHEALHLARRGHDVVAVDLAASPIAHLRSLREPRLTALTGDLFDLPAAARGPFDLAVEHCCYCAIQPARRTEYVEVMHSVLRPGALLVALFFTHGRGGGPPWSTTADELRAVFGERFELLSLEIPWDSAPARRGLETLAVLRR